MPTTTVAEVTANLDGLTTVFTQLNTWISSLVTTIANNSLFARFGRYFCLRSRHSFGISFNPWLILHKKTRVYHGFFVYNN